MFSESFEKGAGVFDSAKKLAQGISSKLSAKEIKKSTDQYSKFREAGKKLIKKELPKKVSGE